MCIRDSYYSVQRGMQQIDALMHSRIANLFYAKYCLLYTSMGGVDSDGNTTDTCALVGTVQLTRYIDDDTYSALKRCV